MRRRMHVTDLVFAYSFGNPSLYKVDYGLSEEVEIDCVAIRFFVAQTSVHLRRLAKDINRNESETWQGSSLLVVQVSQRQNYSSLANFSWKFSFRTYNENIDNWALNSYRWTLHNVELYSFQSFYYRLSVSSIRPTLQKLAFKKCFSQLLSSKLWQMFVQILWTINICSWHLAFDSSEILTVFREFCARES